MTHGVLFRCTVAKKGVTTATANEMEDDETAQEQYSREDLEELVEKLFGEKEALRMEKVALAADLARTKESLEAVRAAARAEKLTEEELVMTGRHGE
jgi:hypothetical protein